MSATHMTDVSTGSSMADQFAAMMATVADAVEARATRRRLLASLQQLDDHLLHDIGLNRADVAKLAQLG